MRVLQLVFLLSIVITSCSVAASRQAGAENLSKKYKTSSSSASPCEVPSNKNYPFCNPNLPREARVRDLLSRIPLNESATLFGNTAGGVKSIQLPPYQWWSEALHGVAYSPGVHYFGNISASTSFPQVCTTGASFNKTLFVVIGDTVGTEGRAMNNLGHAGLTFWAPNINIYRDPRWGRGQETVGEDPYLTSTYAHLFVQNMQNSSQDPTRLRVSSCCKHFTAYDVEDWGGVQRYNFDAIVSDYDMYTTFMPSFESCFHRDGGHGSGIMCSYNAVNGVPMCANGPLITGKARDTWGFDGYVTSDCGATGFVRTQHHYTKTKAGTIEATLTAGMDLDCGSLIQKDLLHAVEEGRVNASTVTNALAHTFSVLFRLGYFDPADSQPLKKLNASDVNTKEAQALAYRAAAEGITLLMYDTNYLPYFNNPTTTNLQKTASTEKMMAEEKQKGQKFVVMGPNANNSQMMLGNYFGQPPYIVNGLQGIQNKCTASYHCEVSFLAGLSSVTSSDVSQFQQACDLAATADNVILYMGNDQSVEAEGRDRTTIALPGIQDLFIHHVASCAKNVTKVTVVVFSGGSVDYTEILKHENVGALLWAGYPGQSGGQAIANILFGEISPSGRVVQTVYPRMYTEQVSMLNMEMAANASSGSPGRTYRYYTGTPVFPFAWGLTYTNWSLHPIQPPTSPILSQTKNNNDKTSEIFRKKKKEVRDDDFRGKLSLRTPSQSSSTRYDYFVDLSPISLKKLTASSLPLHLRKVSSSIYINVTNTGNFPAAFSVLFKVTPYPPGPLVGGTLTDFTKVFLEPGHSQVVELGLYAHAIHFYSDQQIDNDGRRMKLRLGEYRWSIMHGRVEEDKKNMEYIGGKLFVREI